MGLRTLYHRLLGRRKLYQVYTNLTYSTPDRCMEHHGKIVTSEDKVPSVPECNFEVLSFPVGELDTYREKQRRMEDKASRELNRRELFEEGKDKIESEDYQEALTRFEESVKLDIFIPEIGEFCQEYESQLPSDTAKELEDLFILYYKEKFGQKRYERLPEKMREDRKEAGLNKIRNLFD